MFLSVLEELSVIFRERRFLRARRFGCSYFERINNFKTRKKEYVKVSLLKYKFTPREIKKIYPKWELQI